MKWVNIRLWLLQRVLRKRVVRLSGVSFPVPMSDPRSQRILSPEELAELPEQPESTLARLMREAKQRSDDEKYVEQLRNQQA